jgi:energy-coupling factor transporter ATP-binding protein EcfA2
LLVQMGAFTPPPDLKRLRADYLAHLQRSYRALDFKGIPQLRTLPNELALEDVYVPLLARPELPEGETWERRLAGRAFDHDALPEEALQTLGKAASAAPVQIETAVREKARVIVLGDPGSGKSTMLKYMALRLAQERRAPLPILLPLNAYARALARKDLNLQAYLAEYFAGRAQGVAALGPLFVEAIEAGKAIVLLDGLDEVHSGRAELVNRVEDFAHEAIDKGNRVVITSRIVGYRDAPLTPKDWALYTLLDFNDEDIESFARRWCLAFEKSTVGDTPEAEAAAEIERQGLLEAIRASEGVKRLATKPLLLTILALIKRQGVELPKSRIKLYDRYLETLIEAWNRASALDKSAGRASLEYEATLEVLGPLALRLRQENPTAGLVSERQLLKWLTEHYHGEQWKLEPGPAAEKAREFLNNVRRYSNLLVERGEGQYGFIHLTFEEALAAYGLVSAGQIERQKSLDYIQRYVTDPAWRETILLAVGVWGLLHRQPLAAGEMVRAMLQMDCAGADFCQNVLLAGACLEDVGELGLGRAAANEVVEALQAAAANRALPPATQRDAGFVLGRLAGSSRQWLERIRLDLDDFVPIPAGEFLYGDEKEKRRISEPFAVGKYPVTNLQYCRFVEAGGYEQRRWWSEEGWAWRAGTYDSKATEDWEKRWLANRPVE